MKTHETDIQMVKVDSRLFVGERVHSNKIKSHHEEVPK